MMPSTTSIEAAKLPDHEERMRVARSVAGWHLGYSSWADQIIAAYCNPEYAREELAREKAPHDA
jgi:hypothetical protein